MTIVEHFKVEGSKLFKWENNAEKIEIDSAYPNQKESHGWVHKVTGNIETEIGFFLIHVL